MPLLNTSGNVTADAYGGGVAVVPNYIEDVFSTYLYTGTGATQTITNGIDLAGKGGLTWFKRRDNAANHALLDTSRGVNKYLESDGTGAQITASPANMLTSFNAAGFTLGADTSTEKVNAINAPMVSWTFREQPKFFDVVTYTGDGTTGRQIAHSLGSAPGCIIIKKTSAVGSWIVYHQSLGTTKYLSLESTSGASTFSAVNTVTSTYFVSDNQNASGATYVAYVFAHNAGGFGLTGTDNVISCGSYTTNASGGVTGDISLGYEPQYVMMKCTSAISNWYILDTMRGFSQTGFAELDANTSGAEAVSTDRIYPTATGFGVADGVLNASKTWIYIAIRRGPMKVPTDATKVFNAVLNTGTGATATVSGVGFPSDLIISKTRAVGGAGGEPVFFDRLRGPSRVLYSPATVGEAAQPGVTGFDSMTGFTVGSFRNNNASGESIVNECLMRAPGFFDEVCYTGTGALTNFNHNLGVAPELMIVKKRTADNWWVYYTNYGPTNYGEANLNTTGTVSFSPEYTNDWDMAAKPTATVFTQGQYSHTNASGGTYVNYLFATCPGVSKVGIYTGTGATQTINCGFTGGARFVLIKRTDSTGGWYVWDSARGMVAGTDPSYRLNATSSEANANSVYAVSTGFQIVSTVADINASGGTYIYLAIA